MIKPIIVFIHYIVEICTVFNRMQKNNLKQLFEATFLEVLYLQPGKLLSLVAVYK